MIHRFALREPKRDESSPTLRLPAALTAWGVRVLLLVGLILIAIAVTALGSASVGRLLPHEFAYLNLGLVDLGASHHDGTLVGFMRHNRVAFGGTLLMVGWLYVWLAWVPLRRGEAWAWWTLLVSGYLGAGSFVSYAATTYVDRWHALGTIGIALLLGLGLLLSYPRLSEPRGLGSLRPTVQKRPLPLARLCMSVWALGTILGGSIIILTGMFPVFVTEDLEFMRTTVAALEQINPRLVPFIAHDRIGFGGALISAGIAALAFIWHGLRGTSSRPLRWLSGAWLIGTVTAIGIHPVVGYNSLSHLFPFLVKDAAFAVGVVVLAVRGARTPNAEGAQ